MRRGVFDLKIGFNNEPIIKKKCNKIEEIKKVVKGLEAKFK